MNITEEEAKTKRCQESFGPGTEEWVTMPAGRKCIGSACMAWRWFRGEYDQGGQEIATQGYCGKAGKP